MRVQLRAHQLLVVWDYLSIAFYMKFLRSSSVFSFISSQENTVLTFSQVDVSQTQHTLFKLQNEKIHLIPRSSPIEQQHQQQSLNFAEFLVCSRGTEIK